MVRYVVRFVSVGRKRGKTSVASRVVSYLASRGYVVGVVKHSRSSVDPGGKDSSRYLRAGARVVAVSSSSLGAMFYSGWVDELESVLSFLNTPVVIVEGFKKSGTGDIVAVVDNIEEFETLSEVACGNLVAVVTDNYEVGGRLEERVKVFRKSEATRLADLIEARALNYIESQTPKANCGHCGYGSCSAFAKAYITGKTAWCPASSDVSLLVDGRPVSMKPFVKNIIRSTVEGLVNPLKEVGPNVRRITIEVNRA